MRRYLRNIKDKKRFVDKNHPHLSIHQQCRLLKLTRSSYYYKKADKPTFNEREEKAMRIIDKTHLKHSSYGARLHKHNLLIYGIDMSRYKVGCLMKQLHIKSTAPQPKTSIPNKQAKCAPYLLRNICISHSNHVWSTDITYIPFGRKHVYLSVVIDWYSRFIISWRLHETLEAHECVLCVNKAVKKYSTPEILNTDQGSSYTSDEFVECIKKHNIKQSMDGYKRWADNIIIERWFRNLKHEQIYQSEYSSIKQLKEIIAEYVDLYNYDRLHSCLDYQTPAQYYFSNLDNNVLKNYINNESPTDKTCYNVYVS